MIETLASLARAAGHEMPAPVKRSSLPGYGSQLYDAITLGTPTYTGRSVNPNSALASTAVYACVKIISEALATLDLVTYQSGDDWRTKTPATKDYRFRMLREQPNPEMSSYQWREFGAQSLLTWGNWYNYLDIDQRGRIQAIWPLRPDWVMALRNAKTHKLEYRYQPIFPFAVPVPPGVYSDWQILHVPGMGYDGIVGYSPLTMERQAVALQLAQEEYAGRFFANNARPNIVLKTAGTVKDPAQLREEWRRINGGLENAGGVGVLQGGLEIQTLTINPRDAQYLEGRAFQVGEIARIFKVPMFLLGDPSGKTSTYASAEQADLVFVKHCLLPWAKRIEQKLNITILGSKNSLTCKHDFRDLLRGDSASQATAHGIYVDKGIITRNEARADIDHNPIDGADELTVQMQMVPLEDAGQVISKQTEKPAEPDQKPADGGENGSD
jgi:HK97 family phage portal protein